MSSHLRNTIILRGIDFYTPRMRKITQKRQGRKTDLKPNKKMLTDKKSANEMIAEKLNTNVGNRTPRLSKENRATEIPFLYS